jgi:hypothetical protein
MIIVAITAAVRSSKSKLYYARAVRDETQQAAPMRPTSDGDQTPPPNHPTIKDDKISIRFVRKILQHELFRSADTRRHFHALLSDRRLVGRPRRRPQRCCSYSTTCHLVRFLPTHQGLLADDSNLFCIARTKALHSWL